jgi:uncharacterized protein
LSAATNQTFLKKLLHFFLTKMLFGIMFIIASVAIVEGLRSFCLDKTTLSGDFKEVIVAILEASLATATYFYFFLIYDKRKITELSRSEFIGFAIIGFLIGILLQSLFILIIYLTRGFEVIKINPASSLLNPFAFALTAGFVAEIIIIGVVFRLLEKQTGTGIALILFVILFAVLHINANAATPLSVAATALQAGFLLPAAFVFSRSLWLPIFLHFGWDFAEPGIFGGINSSTSLTHSWLTSKITGNILLTGGQTGPQNSLSSVIFCLLFGIVFLILAGRRNKLIKTSWQSLLAVFHV